MASLHVCLNCGDNADFLLRAIQYLAREEIGKEETSHLS